MTSRLPEETRLAKAKKQPVEQKAVAGRASHIEPARDRFTLLQLLIINVAFFLFCVLQFLLVKQLFKETLGMAFFFFYVIWPAFMFVSGFVWIHDQFYKDEDDEF